MIGLAAGPDGYMREGETHDVPRESARQLVASNEAAPADEAAHAEYAEAQAEYADAQAAANAPPETAALRSRGRRV